MVLVFWKLQYVTRRDSGNEGFMRILRKLCVTLTLLMPITSLALAPSFPSFCFCHHVSLLADNLTLPLVWLPSKLEPC